MVSRSQKVRWRKACGLWTWFRENHNVYNGNEQYKRCAAVPENAEDGRVLKDNLIGFVSFSDLLICKCLSRSEFVVSVKLC